MRDRVKGNTGATLDDEIEPPVPVDASLPQISRIVALLGMERWVPEIFGEEPDLLAKTLIESGA
jgi:hypothetical protein